MKKMNNSKAMRTANISKLETRKRKITKVLYIQFLKWWKIISEWVRRDVGEKKNGVGVRN